VQTQTVSRKLSATTMLYRTKSWPLLFSLLLHLSYLFGRKFYKVIVISVLVQYSFMSLYNFSINSKLVSFMNYYSWSAPSEDSLLILASRPALIRCVLSLASATLRAIACCFSAFCTGLCGNILILKISDNRGLCCM